MSALDSDDRGHDCGPECTCFEEQRASLLAEAERLAKAETDFLWGADPREFVGDDGHDWHVTRFPSTACGSNYADVERVDGTKQSVRQAELLRRAGIELPEVTE